MRGQNVLTVVYQCRERKKVQSPIRHNYQFLFVFEFRNDSQEFFEQFLCERQVRLLLKNLRAVIRRSLLQFILRWQCVSVDSRACQCKRVRMRVFQNIFDEKFRWTEFPLKLTQSYRFRRFLSRCRVRIKLQFGLIDGIEDSASGSRIVGIEQVNVQP